MRGSTFAGMSGDNSPPFPTRFGAHRQDRPGEAQVASGLSIPNGVAKGRRRSRFFLLETVAAAALLCLLDERAYAQCAAIDASTVNCSGFDPDGYTITPPPPPGPDVVLTVAAGANVNGPFSIDGLSNLTFNNNGQINGNITVTDNGNFSFDQNGTFGGTTVSVSGAGLNDVLVRAGRSVGTMNLTGGENEIENFGVLNNSVTLNAALENRVLNRAGAAVNQLTLLGPFNTIDNAGLFNQALTFTNGHTDSTREDNADNIVVNRAGATMNGLNSTGGAFDSIDNSGTINGSIDLGAGDDRYTNRAQTSGSVTLGDGNDFFD